MTIARAAMLLALGLGPLAAAAAEVGEVKTVAGTAYVTRGEARLDCVPGLALEQADIVRTLADGTVGITFIDNTRFSAGPNTTLRLARFRFDRTTHEGELDATLETGTLAVTSGKLARQSPEQMKVRTRTSILGVRGTRFAVEVR
jgi:hypothetical protein